MNSLRLKKIMSPQFCLLKYVICAFNLYHLISEQSCESEKNAGYCATCSGLLLWPSGRGNISFLNIIAEIYTLLSTARENSHKFQYRRVKMQITIHIQSSTEIYKIMKVCSVRMLNMKTRKTAEEICGCSEDMQRDGIKEKDAEG